MDFHFYWNQSRDVYDWLVFSCSVALLVVGAWGVRIAVATLRKIERQTRANEIAAEAALQQANHLVASERAWLTAQVMDFPEPHKDSQLIWIPIPITNRGKTSARIDSILVASRLIPVPETSYGMPGKLPEMPDYADRTKVIATVQKYDIIIGPDDTFSHSHAYIFPKEWEDVKAKKLTLYVYGFIDYFDTLKGLRHRTAFCSIYWRTDPRYNEPTGFMFSPIIPAAYFCAT
jgi:hypothetical protein